MCEFCGCGLGRSLEGPAQPTKVRGKALHLRIVAIATRPKPSHMTVAASHQETRPILKEAAATAVASGRASDVRIRRGGC
jgi:hypothetical protein